MHRKETCDASKLVRHGAVVGAAILFALGMICLTGRAERSVRRAQSLRARTLHEEMF